MFTRLSSSRLGALAMAGVLAVAAALVVVVYAHNYRSSVDNNSSTVQVLVATRTIPEFTPGTQVVDGRMYRIQSISRDAVADGAITNADDLKGKVARNDIYPGEQLTENQFTTSTTTSVAVKLAPDQRAVAFPVDTAQGLVGEVQTGDHVDVVSSFDVLPLGPNGLPLTGGQAITLTKTIVSNALVLSAPSDTTTPGTTNHSPMITLAIDNADVNAVMFAQDKGSIWFTLRPPGTAEDVGPGIVDVGAVLRGSNHASAPVLRFTGVH